MPRFSFDSSPQISSGLALLVILVLSLVVGWLTIISSGNIIRSVKESSLIQIEKRGVPVTDVNGNN
ncbi:MAG: hypothetical protein A3J06_03525 [Candidatus Moranbacteria bacterium RIFCSPLOWO2_02_FULL_48_19]|nr:MAG: hypothetical protein A3J06_03525 [Candidatus Moranbacteria bacterium RIFCSPLOWO2_02_FULL_48_19]OGI31967.1 MAG: hypothetical protein A3G09_03350 [Candidatus Moranbacteria bacterium RIFCSPLOWO2_12_FULL_48_12]